MCSYERITGRDAALLPGSRVYEASTPHCRMTTERPLRVAVAGLGYWGPNIARNFAGMSGAELAWCCDADTTRTAPASAPAFPSARFTADLDDLLADDALDAVVLATPVPTHAELADAGARGGQALLRREAAGAVGRPTPSAVVDGRSGGGRC